MPLSAHGQEGINGVIFANAMLLSSWTDTFGSTCRWMMTSIMRHLQEKINNSTFKKDAEGKSLEFAGTF